MPGFDRTGPNGQGSMTGRGLGRCAPAAPVSAEQTTEQTTEQTGAVGPAARQVYGLGRGGAPRGCGRGRGFGGGRRGFR